MLTFFYIINLLGVEITAKLQIVLFIFLIAALGLFVILGVPNMEYSHFSNLFPKGLSGVFMAAGLLFTFCAGGFFVIDMGAEVIQANRVFPRVLVFGILIVVILNLLIMFVVIGVSDPLALKGKSLVHISAEFMSKPAVMFFTVAGALIACATSINVIFSMVGRGLMAVSNDGFLPEILGKVSRRFGTPYYGLTAAYVINAISLVTIPSLLFFGSMLNLGLIVAITLVAVSGLL